jgi:competence protein ComFB
MKFLRSDAMSIRNIMEDIVNSAIDEVLKKEKDSNDTKEYREDICAFVLNRIPPNYVTSERGILHGLLDSHFLLQQKTDILLLIYEAISVINERRDGGTKHLGDELEKHNIFFPHIIGEVVEESTFSKIDNVKVTLLFDGKMVKMMSDSWENPYFTNKGTNSYYHFWPEFDNEPDVNQEYDFSLLFEHDNLEKYEHTFSVKPVKADNISISCSIPVVMMKLKDGEDTSFLF